MTRKMKRVGIAQFQGIENAYVIVSAHARDNKKPMAASGNLDYSVSFLYDAGDVAAEWEPRYGPIQIWRRADKQQTDVKEHYFYALVLDEPGAFSQLAVEREGLPQAFASGNYEHIFDVLREWTKNR